MAPQNDAPQATNLTQNKSYTEGAASVALDNIVVTEFDTSPAQSILATLTLNNTATGSLTTGTFGTLTSTYNPISGIWVANGAISDVNAALAAVAFNPVTNNDVGTTITTRIEDQASVGPPDGTITLDVIPQNDAPQATNTLQLKTYTVGAPSVALDDIVVSEVDTAPAQTITATLTLLDATTGVLSASSGNGESYAAGTGVWMIAGSVAQVNAALADVAFLPTLTNGLDTSVSIHIEDQGGVGPADGSIALDVTGNNTPSATNLTQTHVYLEDVAAVSLNDIVVADLDGTDTLTVTLTLNDATTGLITSGTGNGETYAAGTGIWTITGTEAQVNAALAAAEFHPTLNNDADTTISTLVLDQDGTGPAGGVITLDVTPQNDAPQATNLDQTKSYAEGAPSVALDNILVSEVDTNPNQVITARLTLNDTATGSLTTASGNGESYNSGSGVWTVTGTIGNVNAALAAVEFIPLTNNDVDTTITSHIEDQDSAGPTDGTIVLDVTPVNDAPTLTSFATPIASTLEDTEIEVFFADLTTAGDEVDIDGSVIGFVVKSILSGTLKIGANAATATVWVATTNDTVDVTNRAYWTPALNINGTLNAFEVVARDDAGAESVGNVMARINVTPVNDKPVAVVESYSVDADGTLTIAANGVLNNDSDVEGDPLHAAQISGPGNGTLTLNVDGSFTYTPNAGFSGTDSFRYVADDGNLDSNPIAVTITVNPIAGPPPVTPPADPDPPPNSDPPPDADATPVLEVAAVTLPSPPASAPASRDRSSGAMAGATTVTTTQPRIESLETDTTSDERLERIEWIARTVRESLSTAAGGVMTTFVASFDAGLLWDDLSELEKQFHKDADTPFFAAGSAAGATSALSVGYVLWTIRSGWLATSLLAQMPAWRIIDPLVVLDYLDDDSSDSNGEDDSLESLLEEKESETDQERTGDPDVMQGPWDTSEDTTPSKPVSS